MASAISGETLNKAMKELGEIPEKRMEFIRALRVRLEQWVPNPHDPDEERLVLRRIDDDKFLLCFLRARKFDVERASILFVNYYKYRLKYASLMSELTPEAVEPLLKENLLYVLPQRSQDGCKALVGKFVKFNIEGGKPLAELLSMILVVLDKLIEDEETQVHGMMFCQDLSDLTLIKVMALVGKEQFKKGMLIKLIQDAFPARFKGFHVINQPWYVSIILRIARPFMRQKTKDRIHMHGWDYSSLHKFLPPEHLPAEYGGQLESLEAYSAKYLFSN